MKLTLHPEAAPLRPELSQGIRMAPFGRYLVFYTTQVHHIRIERILHGSRRMQDLFDA